MNKYEQLIEYIINEQEDKAKELFHQIVVEKSREIYESLIDETDLAEVGGNDVESMVDEITSDEEGMQEGEGEEEFDVELDGEEDEDGMGDDMGGDMNGGDEGGIEDRVMDLEDALDELKAEFDALMSQEAGEEEHNFGGDDDGMDDGEGGDDDGMDDGEGGEFDMMEEDVEESVQESRKPARKMTEAEWIREYVEKIGEYPGDQKSPSGKNVGAGTGDNEQQGESNTKSVVAGKNDMGGTTQNIARGGDNGNPDNKPVPQPNNQYSKGKGNLPGAGQFKNVPGGDAGKTSYKSKAPSAKTGEEGGINKKSIES